MFGKVSSLVIMCDDVRCSDKCDGQQNETMVNSASRRSRLEHEFLRFAIFTLKYKLRRPTRDDEKFKRST